ncbi:MAG: hypothetical protein WAT16_02955 [Saprospiraceae bacterium]
MVLSFDVAHGTDPSCIASDFWKYQPDAIRLDKGSLIDFIHFQY